MFDKLHERHEERRERREERREEKRERHHHHDRSRTPSPSRHHQSQSPPHAQAPQAPYSQAPYGQAAYDRAPYSQAPYAQGQAPYAQAQAPYGEAPQSTLDRRDFVSDNEFQSMLAAGTFTAAAQAQSRIGPEDFGEYDPTSRRQGPGGYQPQYLPPKEAPPVPQGQGQGQHGGYASPPGPPGGGYAAPSGAPPGYGRSAYAPPSGPPPGQPSQTPQGNAPQGGFKGGEASQYYNQGEAQSHPYAHIPALAAAHDDSGDASLYHEAAQGMHQNYASHNPYGGGSGGDQYAEHFAAHDQAYGPNSEHSNTPMATDAIGAAAAVEALKMTAAQNSNQSQGPPSGRPAQAQGNRPNAPVSGPPRPSGPQKPTKPQESGSDSESESEDEGPARKPQGQGQAPPSSGGGPQDKIIALAMAQAGKLFDKKGGGDSSGKSQAMQTAGMTAMRLMGEYKTTGKVNLEPGEMQKLMGVAMSLF